MSTESLNYYQAVLADLRKEREKIDFLIEGLESRIKGMGGTVEPAPTAVMTFVSVQETPRSAPGPYAGMTIYEAAEKYLAKAGEPKSTRDIFDALTQGGLPDIQYNAAYTAIWRRVAPKGNFIRYGDTHWGLVGWKDFTQTPAQAPAPQQNQDRPAEGKPPQLDYVERILRDEGIPLHISTIISRLNGFGYNPTRDSLSGNLRKEKKQRFKNYGNNVWGLGVWAKSDPNQGRKENKLPYEV